MRAIHFVRVAVAAVTMHVSFVSAQAPVHPPTFGSRPIIRSRAEVVPDTWAELLSMPSVVPCGGCSARDGCVSPGAVVGPMDPDALGPMDPDALGPMDPDALGPMTPGEMGPDVPYDPSPDLLAGSFGSAYGPPAPVPNMIGDFFENGSRFTGMTGPDATVMVAGGDRRFKIVEGNSPIPTDRVFFNFNHFQNALQAADGNDPLRSLDRYTFGVEKTLFDKRLSVEFRLPFAGGLNSSQHADGSSSFMATELGNLALAVKAIVRQRRNYRMAVGLAITFPTGDDALYYSEDGLNDGGLEGVFKNESVHLQPFLGVYWEPNDRLFALFFAQLDFDASGNEVTLYDIRPATALPPITDTYSDQNLGFVDFSLGYWVYKNPQACWITGIAPVFELHYTTTLQDTDTVSLGPDMPTIANPGNRMNLLNLTAGLHCQIGPHSTLTVAAVAPLKDEADRQFDSELVVEFNRRF
ncbi:MAG: hypothetical protein HQ567_21385 [Candidatus Nealsonbacteria bacterium]|nr:hypothetical protein [Candidatus Nealsonbacteria bacterium]